MLLLQCTAALLQRSVLISEKGYHMSTIKCTENGFSYSTRDERLLIESYGKNCIRVRATKNGSFSDERHTLLAARESSPVNVGTQSAAAATLSTSTKTTSSAFQQAGI